MLLTLLLELFFFFLMSHFMLILLWMGFLGIRKALSIFGCPLALIEDNICDRCLCFSIVIRFTEKNNIYIYMKKVRTSILSFSLISKAKAKEV